MPNRFLSLPDRTLAPAYNMAEDLLMLESFPEPTAIRFRHYGWDCPCHTFGYSQKIDYVYSHVECTEKVVRRPTGGGIVDHRNDWTFALVIPRSHPFSQIRASKSYYYIHKILAETLQKLDFPVVLTGNSTEKPDHLVREKKGPGICFSQPEIYDVIHAKTYQKIAGAAQKRNRHGLLFQGSILKSATGPIDWDHFGSAFIHRLAELFETTSERISYPRYPQETLIETRSKFSSKAWNTLR